MNTISKADLSALSVRERQALLRLNKFAWYASGRTRRPLLADMIAAIKAIRFLSGTEERKHKYFEGSPGCDAQIDEAHGLYRFETLRADVEELDPARFVRGARPGAMMVERAVLENAASRSR